MINGPNIGQVIAELRKSFGFHGEQAPNLYWIVGKPGERFVVRADDARLTPLRKEELIEYATSALAEQGIMVDFRFGDDEEFRKLVTNGEAVMYAQVKEEKTGKGNKEMHED